ncbi:hypothetical protein DERP_000260 [Dermatophagoides pteronyssinus]|uniref:Uncharacterized protein n=1 Tax=Dermatophagoides pteronyssinus TaxID=6956 RepID=A0ABQ8IZM3_DERPT|nr:hypothetical protein DERP_000260 [Dermatophagoides pteronyssinus]
MGLCFPNDKSSCRSGIVAPAGVGRRRWKCLRRPPLTIPGLTNVEIDLISFLLASVVWPVLSVIA